MNRSLFQLFKLKHMYEKSNIIYFNNYDIRFRSISKDTFSCIIG